MSIFKDEAYENLDWMSQAVEPLVCHLNDYLAELPDEKELSVQDIMKFHNSFSVSSCVNAVIMLERYDISYDERDILIKCFDVKAPATMTLDYETNSLDGQVFVVKEVSQIPEEKIFRAMEDMVWDVVKSEGRKPITYLVNLLLPESKQDIIDAKRRGTLSRVFRRAIISALKENKWPVKNYSLWRSILKTIDSYIAYENDEDLAKLALFSVMLKSKTAIYSIKGF